MSKNHDTRKQVRLTPSNYRNIKNIMKMSDIPITVPWAVNRAVELGTAHLANELAANKNENPVR